DNYARIRLALEIQDLEEWMALDASAVRLDVWDWLRDLPIQTRVLGSSPRPGCLHVANIKSGGHSGRPHTYIVGLHDSRFPGAGLQDPLLLDREREKLSSKLPRSLSQIQERLHAFARLLARLRGHLTLTFPCGSLRDDRELFPSPILLSVHRILTGDYGCDQGKMLGELPPAAAFAPDRADRCLDESDWWLWRLCGDDKVADPMAAVLARYPH